MSSVEVGCCANDDNNFHDDHCYLCTGLPLGVVVNLRDSQRRLAKALRKTSKAKERELEIVTQTCMRAERNKERASERASLLRRSSLARAEETGYLGARLTHWFERASERATGERSLAWARARTSKSERASERPVASADKTTLQTQRSLVACDQIFSLFSFRFSHR